MTIGGIQHTQIPPIPLPVCKEQQRQIDIHTKNDIDHKVIRIVRFYLTENNGWRLIQEVSSASAKGGIIGFLTGSSLGLGIKQGIELFAPLPIKLAFAGISATSSFIWGGVVGGIVGALGFGTVKGYITIETDLKSDPYFTWRKEAIENEVFSIYREVIEREDLALQEFVCPLSLDLIQSPCLASDGHVYEREYILDHLDRVEERAEQTEDQNLRTQILQNNSPMRGAHIVREGLRYDWEYHSRLCQRLNELLDQNTHELEQALPRIAEIGLRRYRESMQTPAKQILEEMMQINQKMYQNGNISLQLFQANFLKLSNHYHPFTRLRSRPTGYQEEGNITEEN